jgi:hypothetical protein
MATIDNVAVTACKLPTSDLDAGSSTLVAFLESMADIVYAVEFVLRCSDR